jgi:DNA-binding MarR family transcriptional regulator
MCLRVTYLFKWQFCLGAYLTVIDLEKGILKIVRSGGDLTARQLAVLLSCRSEPRTVRWLAADLNISKPGISRAADKLGVAKFTVRKNDGEDRRSVLIALTAAGRKYVDSLLND